MILESFCHKQNLFLTLTYDNDHLPSDGSVSPREMQLFIKRLRKAVAPVKFRFFLVGEYGPDTFRPHYHLAIFGLGFEHEAQIAASWTYGFYKLGDLTEASAGYVGGYVTKKMTKADDPRLEGRHPEFVRMSLKPGIGCGALDVIEMTLKEHDLLGGDVPTVLRHGKKIYPLGRYLRSKLRERLNFTDEHLELLKQKAKESLSDVLVDKFGSKVHETSSVEVWWDQIERLWRNPQMDLNLKARYNLKKRTI